MTASTPLDSERTLSADQLATVHAIVEALDPPDTVTPDFDLDPPFVDPPVTVPDFDDDFDLSTDEDPPIELRVTGGPGTGKTYLMSIVAEHVLNLDRVPVILAPSHTVADKLRVDVRKHMRTFRPTSPLVSSLDSAWKTGLYDSWGERATILSVDTIAKLTGTRPVEAQDADRADKAELHGQKSFGGGIDGPSAFAGKWKTDPSIVVLLVDEASMVDERVYDLLRSYKAPIVWFGDVNQLPPIRKEEKGNNASRPGPVFHPRNSSPIYRLTTNHRQSPDSPIRHVVESFLADGSLAPFEAEDVLITPDHATFRRRLFQAFAEEHEQMQDADTATRIDPRNRLMLFAGRNAVVDAVNNALSKRLLEHDLTDYQPGEVVQCLSEISNNSSGDIPTMVGRGDAVARAFIEQTNDDERAELHDMIAVDETIPGDRLDLGLIGGGVRNNQFCRLVWIGKPIIVPDLAPAGPLTPALVAAFDMRGGFGEKAWVSGVFINPNRQRYNTFLADLRSRALSETPRSQAARMAWRRFYDAKDRYVARLAPPWAMTTHRGQGLTCRGAFVDAEDIMGIRPWDDTTKCHSIYVGISRPREILGACFGEEN